jgi:hypothetical protein
MPHQWVRSPGPRSRTPLRSAPWLWA